MYDRINIKYALFLSLLIKQQKVLQAIDVINVQIKIKKNSESTHTKLSENLKKSL